LLDRNLLKCSSIVFGYEQFNKSPSDIIHAAKLFGAKYAGIGWVDHCKSFGKAEAEKLAGVHLTDR
jgi:hypothetical protein